MNTAKHRFWLTISGLLLLPLASMGASCSGKSTQKEVVRQKPQMPGYRQVERPTPDARVILVTDLKGYLEPCGCTSRPLGGIDRLAAKVEQIKRDGVPTATVFAGPTFVGGEAPKGVDPELARSQLEMSSKTLTRVLKEYADVLLVAPKDERWAPKEMLAPSYAFLPQQTAQQCQPPACHSWSGPDLIFHGAKTSAPSSDSPGLTFKLALGSRKDAANMARSEQADFVILAGVSSHPPEPPNAASGAPILNAGRQGQGLVQLDLYIRGTGPFEDWSDWTLQVDRERKFDRIKELDARIVAWKKDPKVDPANVAVQEKRLEQMKAELAAMQPPQKVDGNAFVATYFEFPPEASKAPKVSKILEQHFKELNETNKKLYADLKPEPAPEGSPSYAGSASCASCHQEAFRWWRGHAHGRAYKTLVDVDKEYNLKCVGCHVTGYMKPGGSTVTHNLGGKLVDVGCESCHGPGSLHNQKPEAHTLNATTPESTCVSCHNEEHSDKFDYRIYTAMLRAPGHGQPVK